MNLTLPASLANLTISQLNFTSNCSNVALGLTVWTNDFNNYNATPGNQTATNDLPGGIDNPTVAQGLDSGNDTSDEVDQSVDPVDNGPADDYTGYYIDFWTNGTSPEWLNFWRAALASALPTTYMNLTDAEITQCSNTTDAFEFFDPQNANYWNPPTDKSQVFFTLINITYAMFDSYIDIRFLWYLRLREQDISSADNEDQWGYGQILALFVWVPTFVEYFYVFGKERKLWGKVSTKLEKQMAERSEYEIIERANE